MFCGGFSLEPSIIVHDLHPELRTLQHNGLYSREELFFFINFQFC